MDEPFDRIMASADPAMIIVTTVAGTERSGCLVGFHGQASIEPERYAVWLSKANHTHGVAMEADWVAVHFLTADDIDLARWFGTTTGDQIDKFAGLTVSDGPDGLPLLDRCPNRIVGRVALRTEVAGDHTCVVLDPAEVTAADGFRPLRLSAVTHLDPGHEADDHR